MSETRECTICKTAKVIEEFVKDPRCAGGRRHQCKACRKAARDAYFPPEKVAAYNKAYFATGTGKEAKARGNKKWRQGAGGKAYGQRQDVRDYRNRKMVRYRERNPAKEAARQAVRAAKRRGEMVPASQLTCTCGAHASEYHHHKGYAPEHHLDVVPLCKECHWKAELK